MLGRSLTEQIESQRRWHAELRQEGGDRIDGWLTVAARSLEFHEDLVKMGASGARWICSASCPQHRLESALVAGRRALEFRDAVPRGAPRLARSGACVHGRTGPEDREARDFGVRSGGEAAGLSALPRALAGEA
ncbi:MAG: hypothetical protein R3B70_45710 [Polyangiaceae bacterium]